MNSQIAIAILSSNLYLNYLQTYNNLLFVKEQDLMKEQQEKQKILKVSVTNINIYFAERKVQISNIIVRILYCMLTLERK